jgi:hypothetical protein
VDAERQDWARVVADVISRADPLELIRGGAPRDEYEPEAGAIAPRVGEAASAAELQKLVYSEFVGWFGERVAGPVSRYRVVAHGIWHQWLLRRARILSNGGSVELLDTRDLAVRYIDEPIRPLTAVRIDGRVFVESEDDPGQWWMGAFEDAVVRVWGRYGSHERAFAEH